MCVIIDDITGGKHETQAQGSIDTERMRAQVSINVHVHCIRSGSTTYGLVRLHLVVEWRHGGVAPDVSREVSVCFDIHLVF